MTLPPTELKIKITYELIDNNKRVLPFSSECPVSRVKDRLSGVYVYVERTTKEADRSVGRIQFLSRNTSKYVICYDDNEEEEEQQELEQQEQQEQKDDQQQQQKQQHENFKHILQRLDCLYRCTIK